jgi:hypothetical protein
MKVKDLLNNIETWFTGLTYYCEFITDVQETYNEKPINLKYCYISDICINDENKTVDITLERDLDNSVFIYRDDFKSLFDDIDPNYDITFWYEIEHYKTRIIDIDEVTHPTNECLKIKFTERK